MFNKARLFLACLIAGLMGLAVNVEAAAPDFSTLTAAVDFSTVITAILSVLATMAGVYIIWKGGKMILRAIKGA